MSLFDVIQNISKVCVTDIITGFRIINPNLKEKLSFVKVLTCKFKSRQRKQECKNNHYTSNWLTMEVGTEEICRGGSTDSP